MIHVIMGPPCAGKSTFVAEHAAEGDIRVDFDRLAQALGSSVPHGAKGDVASVAFQARQAVIDAVLDGIGVDSWIIHTTPDPVQMERYKEKEAEITVLDPGIEVCLERAEQDGRPEASVEAIHAWYKNQDKINEEKEIEQGKGATMRKVKDYQISGVKAGPDDGLGEGIFEAYASVFGNIDSYGDVVAKGAFANTLQQWAESGNVIPALYGHNMGDPFYNIGAVTKAEEDEHGLKVEVQLDLENPTAVQVYKLMKGRRLSQMSFAFDVLASGETEVDGEKANELRELQLFEVSVVPVGANQETEILSVKSQADALARGLKEGRVLATKHINSLRKAQEAIGEVIEAAEATGSETAKASQTASPLTPKDPEKVKGQEPAGSGHAAAVYAYLKLATLTGQN